MIRASRSTSLAALAALAFLVASCSSSSSGGPSASADDLPAAVAADQVAFSDAEVAEPTDVPAAATDGETEVLDAEPVPTPNDELPAEPAERVVYEEPRAFDRAAGVACAHAELAIDAADGGVDELAIEHVTSALENAAESTNETIVVTAAGLDPAAPTASSTALLVECEALGYQR